MSNLRQLLCAAVVATVALGVRAGTALAAGGTWNVDADGNWSVASNWLGGIVADGAGATANLTYDITDHRTVTIDSDSTRTVGILNMGDANRRYTLAGDPNTSALIFDNGGSTAQLNMNVMNVGYSCVVNVPLRLKDSLEIKYCANSASNFKLNGAISAETPGTKTITVIGSGGSGGKDFLDTAAVISDGNGVVAIVQNSDPEFCLVLLGNNTFTGGVTLNSGRLGLKNATALGAPSSRLTINGGMFDTYGMGHVAITNANPVTINADFEFSGSQGALDLGTGPISLGDTPGPSRTITATGGNALTLRGAISDGTEPTTPATSLIKAGTGTLILSGANVYTGTTTVSNGTLQLSTPAALYNGETGKWTGDYITVASAATLRLLLGGTTGFTVTDLGTLLDGDHLGGSTDAAGLLSGATLVLDTASGEFSCETLIANPYGGANILKITKAGAGTLTFAAANTYTGLTTVSAGTLAYGVDNALGDGPITVSGGTLDIKTFSDTVGPVTLTSGTITGTSGVLTSTSGFTMNNAAAASVSAVLAGDVGLTKSAAGVLTLSAANTYTGLTTVSAGTLAYGVDNAIADGAAVTVSGGTLDIKTFSDTVGTVTLTSGTITGAAGVLTSTADFDVRAGTVSAVLNGSVGLTKTTTGTVTLSKANTYTGTTTVSAGTLAYGIDNAIADGAAVTVSGGMLDIKTFSDTVGLVTLTGGTIAGTTGVLTSTADFDVRGGTVSAVLNGSVGLTKTTTGTVTISSVNTCTGVTTIAAGGGILAVADLADGNSPSGIGQSSNAAGNLLIGNAGTLRYTGAGGSTDRLFTINGTVAGHNATLDASGAGPISFTNTGSLAYGAAEQARTLTLTGANTGDNTFAAVIANNGAGATSLTKSGAGTWVLASANSYTGLTSITGGTLAYGVDNAIAGGAVTVNGGTLDIRTFSAAVGTVTLTSGTIAGTTGVLSSTATYAVAAGTVSAVLGGSVGLTKTGSGTVILTGANTYTGTTIITAGALRAADGTGLPNTSLLQLNGGVLETSGVVSRFIGTSAPNVQWNADGGFSAYDGTLTVNLNNGSELIDWAAGIGVGLNGKKLIFGSATANNVVTLTNSLDMKGAARTITVNDNTGTAGDYAVVSGAISNSTGAQALTKDGAGTLALTGTNEYSGTTVITNGALRAADGTGLPSASLLQLNGGVIETSGTFSRSIGTAGGNVQWNAAGGFAAQGGALTVNLNGGSGLIDWAAAIGLGLNGKNLIFGSVTADNLVTLTNSLDMKGAARTITVNDNISTTADYAVISGVISNSTGAQALTKAGAGTLALSGNNTFGGGLILSAGQLNINAQGTDNTNSAIGTGMLTINGGTIDATNGPINLTGTTNNAVTIGGNFAFGGTNALNLGTGAVTVSDNRTITLKGNNPLTLGAATNTKNNTTTLTVNNGAGAGSSTVLNLASYALTGGGNTAARTITITGTGNVAITGGVTNGQAYNNALTKSGASTLTISGASSYTGTTTVSGGILRADDNAGLPGLSSTGGGSYLNLAGGVLETGANLERSGAGTGQGQMRITSGTSGFSAYGAPVQVAFGSLASPNALAWGTAPFIPGTFVLNSATANNTIEFVNNVSLANAARTVQVNANVATMSGLISSTGTSGGLTKTGSGTLVLAGANTYTGATNVSAGALLVNGNQSAATGAVTVQGGAALGGGGTIGGAITVNAGGHLSPGAGVGTLRTGAVTMADGAVYDMEIGSAAADEVVVTGNVTFNGFWQIVLADGGGLPKASDQFDLFTYSGDVLSLGTPVISAGTTGWTVTGATIMDDNVSRVYITGITSIISGDTNGDKVVDAADFVTLKKNFGKTTGAGASAGDFDKSGSVNWADLNVLTNNMGPGGAAPLGGLGPATTPEPATLGLLALGALAVLRRRRK